MVNYHVGDSTDALCLESVDHRAQFCLITKGTVVVIKPPQVIVSHGIATTVAALWNPYETETAGEVVCLRLEGSPLAIVIRVPIESLQHYTAIVGRPTLSGNSE